MKSILHAFLVLLLMVVGVQLFAVELPAVTFIGRITDPEGLEPSLADPNASVLLCRADNQAALARGNIQPISNTRFNYVIHSPMTDQLEDVLYGQSSVGVHLKITIGDREFTSPKLVLPEAGTLVKYDLAFATDANGNGVADEYEEMLGPDMAAEGIDGPYDADADYDGDGMSNRDEYYAGTDPFNAADRLAIVALTPKAKNDHTAVEFIIARGHSYAVKAGDNLASALEETRFRTAPDASAATYERLNVASTYEATAVLYLLPDDATKKFIRVAVDAISPTPPATDE